MIYFLINNNYQYHDFELHLSGINKCDVSLIEVPHALDERQHSGFSSFFRYFLASKNGLIAEVNNFFKVTKRIDYEIQPNKNDVLFFYTEHELLNHYIVAHFKKIGARVYLIEDGGFATYIPFRMTQSESLTGREKIKQLIYGLLPGLSGICLHKMNGYIFPRMLDSSIDGVCLYKPVKLNRSIPTKLLRRPYQPQLSSVTSGVIFLNEPIYDNYQNSENYLDGLEKIIAALCNKFSKVLFKYHPRETDEWREYIKQKVLFRFPKVIVIEENAIVEVIVEQYCPSLVASYFCAALLSLSDRGIEPLYLYHLIPELNGQPIFLETTAVLKEIGYNFVASFAEIDPSFRSGFLHKVTNQSAISLTELVDGK